MSRAGRHAYNAHHRSAPRKTAYLVGVINVGASPPCVVKAAIFSEPTPTMVGEESLLSFVIASVTADTFDDAYLRIGNMIRARPIRYNWVLPLLSDDSLRDLGLPEQRRGTE